MVQPPHSSPLRCPTDCRERLQRSRLKNRVCRNCGEVFEPNTMRHMICIKRYKDRAHRRGKPPPPKKERQPAEPRPRMECDTVFVPQHPAAVFRSIKCGRRFRYREGPAKRLSDFLCEEVKEAT